MAVPHRRRTHAPTPAELLEPRRLLSAGPQLLADINTTPADSQPSEMVEFRGAVYYANTTPAAGRELWRSDGTPGGTALFKDIYPGPSPSAPGNFTVVGDTLFFSAADATHGRELWKTDGTPQGTTLVADINPGPVGNTFFQPAALGNVLTVIAMTSSTTGSLWRSDGTAAGTFVLGDVQYNVSGAPPRDTRNTAAIGDTLLFRGFDPVHGAELWKTDGTPEGTVLVKDIATGAGVGSYPADLTVSGGRVFFVAEDAGLGAELWSSDGTADGTVPLTELSPDQSSPSTPPRAPAELTPLGNGVVFRVVRIFATLPLPSGPNLWRSDGTAAGTVPLADTGPHHGDHTYTAPPPETLLNLGDTVYYTARAGSELWQTDGSDAGVLVARMPAGAYAHSLTAVGESLAFRVDGAGRRGEIWTSDGTEAGTAFVAAADAPRDPPRFLDPRQPVALGDVLLFHANDGTGRALVRTDLTPAGTSLVARYDNGTASSDPASPLSLGHTAVFGANEGVSGATLWKTDGTPAGTARVLDFDPAVKERSVRPVYSINGRALVEVAAPGLIGEWWTTDGTAAGTARFPVAPEPLQGAAGSGSNLYFAVGSTLWKTDGTPAGTSPVKSVPLSYLYGVTAHGDDVYFVARVSGTRYALWRSDGTAAGTAEVAILPGSLRRMVSAGGTLFLGLDNPMNDNRDELWTSDGTPAGTRLLKEWGAGSADLGVMTEHGGLLLFQGWDAEAGTDLWRSDGTAEGTARLADTAPGLIAGGLQFAGAAGGLLYFRSSSGLWRTDGTAGGTFMLKARLLYPGSAAAVGDTLYFAATFANDDVELWRTDGTVEGTRPAADIAPGYAAPPEGLTAVGDTLVFAASDAAHGKELFAYTPGPSAVVGRHLYYHNSPLAASDPDAALAPDKLALLPDGPGGGSGGFANVSNYTLGLNGVVLDVAGLPYDAQLGPDDFTFTTPGGRNAPAPSSIEVRRGAGGGGSDRVTITWPDHAIRNTWLRVTLKATADTGLAAPDTFSFGHLAADTGGDLRVNATDVAAVKRSLTTSAVPLTNPHDLNRDGRVNALDVAAVKANLTRTLGPMVWDEDDEDAGVAA